MTISTQAGGESGDIDFAQALIALGQHMQLVPNLPAVASVRWSFWTGHEHVDGLDIQLGLSGDAVERLSAWAATLADVSSDADRLKGGGIHRHVYGRLGDLPVCVWASGLDGALFPEEPGRYEWDVRIQLQEA